MRKWNRRRSISARRQAAFATALAVRGLSSIKAISPINTPGPAVSSIKSPRKISISPSNNTYILSLLSPSRKRKSPGSSCSASVSWRKSSAGFINAVLVGEQTYRGSEIPAKLQLCGSCSERHAGNKFFVSFVRFVVNFTGHLMNEERKTLEQRATMTDLERLRHSASHVLAACHSERSEAKSKNLSIYV